MRSDQVRWLRAGARMPPVIWRWSPKRGCAGLSARRAGQVNLLVMRGSSAGGLVVAQPDAEVLAAIPQDWRTHHDWGR
jgi:hypothetical protein